MAYGSRKIFGKLGIDQTAEQIPNETSSDQSKMPVPVDVAKEANAAVDEKTEVILDQKVSNLHPAQNQYGRYIIQIPVGQRLETIDLESETASDHLKHIFKTQKGLAPDRFINDLKVRIRNRVRQDGKTIRTFQRVGVSNGAYYIDLGAGVGSAIEISGGQWRVVDQCTCPFIRPRGYESLPYPEKIGGARSAFYLLVGFLLKQGVPQSKIPLVIVSLVCALREGVTYPVLLFFGPPGSGKSTVLLLLLMLVDPPSTPQLPNIGQKTEHIAAAAQHRHVLTMDNLSKLSVELQDTICTCATGGEILQRELYTNGGVAVLPIHRPVWGTGVTNVLTRPDLLSRGIPVGLPVRKERKSREEILAEFNDERERLFGALLELTAISTISFDGELPVNNRLFEFCLAGQRIFHAVGRDAADFMRLVERLRLEVGTEMADGDPFVKAIREFLNKHVTGFIEGDKLPGYKAWWAEGVVSIRTSDGSIVVGVRAQHLLVHLPPNHYPNGGWTPKTSRELSNGLLRATPIFESVGIEVNQRRYGRDRPYWEFRWKPEKDG